MFEFNSPDPWLLHRNSRRCFQITGLNITSSHVYLETNETAWKNEPFFLLKTVGGRHSEN